MTAGLSSQEEQKILYYYPEHEAVNRKVRNIGLCEALVNFTKTFHPDRPCEAVHTDRKRQIFLEPEPNIWTVMVGSPFNNDRVFSIAVSLMADGEYTNGGAGEQWREDGPVRSRPRAGGVIVVLSVPHTGSGVQDEVLEKALQRSYSMFKVHMPLP